MLDEMVKNDTTRIKENMNKSAFGIIFVLWSLVVLFSYHYSNIAYYKEKIGVFSTYLF